MLDQGGRPSQREALQRTESNNQPRTVSECSFSRPFPDPNGHDSSSELLGAGCWVFQTGAADYVQHPKPGNSQVTVFADRYHWPRYIGRVVLGSQAGPSTGAAGRSRLDPG